MKNTGIKCDIGITYEKVERLNTYFEKSVNGADQIHIVAGVHDKQATTFSGKIYEKDNAPEIKSVEYPIEFNTNKVAFIDLRVNKMYTDEFDKNFIKCRSLTEENIRKIVSAMQREVFGIEENDYTINEKRDRGSNGGKTIKSKRVTPKMGVLPINTDAISECKNDVEREMLSSLHPVEVVKQKNGKGSKYVVDYYSMETIIKAIEHRITTKARIANVLNISKTNLDSKIKDWAITHHTYDNLADADIVY